MKIFILALFISLSLFADETKEGEYSISGLKNHGPNVESYYDSLGIPDLYVSSECRKNCKKNCCYNVFRDLSGKIKKSFSTNDSIRTMAKSRYEGKSYLLYAHTYGPKKDRKTKVVLVDNRLKHYPTLGATSAYDLEVSKDAKIIAVRRSGIYVSGERILEKMNFESGRIKNDHLGNIGVVAVDDDSRSVYVSNLKEMKYANITLASRSDKNGVLAVYPSADSVYAVAYNLINIYNKGLMGAKVDFKTSEVSV